MCMYSSERVYVRLHYIKWTTIAKCQIHNIIKQNYITINWIDMWMCAYISFVINDSGQYSETRRRSLAVRQVARNDLHQNPKTKHQSYLSAVVVYFFCLFDYWIASIEVCTEIVYLCACVSVCTRAYSIFNGNVLTTSKQSYQMAQV